MNNTPNNNSHEENAQDDNDMQVKSQDTSGLDSPIQKPAQLTIESLTAQYKQKLPQHIDRLQFLWDGLRFINWSDRAVDSITSECHKISGSAGSFGFKEVSEICHDLDQLFSSYKNATLTPSETDKQHISDSLDKLKELTSVSKINANKNQSLPRQSKTGQGTRVFLIDDDEYYDELMKMKLEALGFEVHVYTNPYEAFDDLELYDPQLFIVDMEFSNTDIDGLEVVRTLRDLRGELVPIIFATRREDFRARLSAIRAGCQAYVTKPVNLDDLTSTINVLVGKQTFNGCKVLIVDDDEDLTKLFEHYLNKIGIECMCINNPIHSLRAIRSFNPHLMLVDVHMKNCTGIELAQVIRSESGLTGLGMIFISGDEDHKWQKQALALNTNGILLKPVTEHSLVQAVQKYLLNSQKQAQRLFQVTHLNPETTLHNSGFFLHSCRERIAKSNGETVQSIFYISFSNYYQYIKTGSIIDARDAMISLGKLIRSFVGDEILATQWGKNGFLVFLDSREAKKDVETANELQATLQQSISSYIDELKGITLHYGLARHISNTELKDAIMIAQDGAKEAILNHQDTISVNLAITEEALTNKDELQEIEEAIKRKDFALFYQPIISMDGSQETLPIYECFIRLKGVDDQFFRPNKFINLIKTERSKIDLNRWIIQNALEAITSFIKSNGEQVLLHVKIPPEFVRHRDSLIWLANTIREKGLRDPSCLVFEFNEKEIAAYGSQGEFFASQFLRLGCGLVIEHFGSTDISDQMLQSYRPNMVKFDAELMNQFCKDDLAKQKVLRLIELADYHQAQVVGHGVEDAMQVTELWGAGVRLFQGYFFAEPMEQPNYDFAASISFD
jgi:multidomain signaling protein FimX